MPGTPSYLLLRYVRGGLTVRSKYVFMAAYSFKVLTINIASFSAFISLDMV